MRDFLFSKVGENIYSTHKNILTQDIFLSPNFLYAQVVPPNYSYSNVFSAFACILIFAEIFKVLGCKHGFTLKLVLTGKFELLITIGSETIWEKYFQFQICGLSPTSEGSFFVARL